MRSVLERGLTQAGYRCLIAANARQGADVLKSTVPDLVVLDINMPGKPGTEFLTEIRAQYPDVAVIMLTGVADVYTAVQAMRDGAYDYTTKPVSLAELIIRVENALSRRSLQIENRSYRDKLESVVDELNAALEQRNRELAALNKLLSARMKQGEVAEAAFVRLQDALSAFSYELAGLASTVGVTRGETPEVPPRPSVAPNPPVPDSR